MNSKDILQDRYFIEKGEIMDVKIEELSLNELISLFKAMQELIVYLETKEDTQIEKRK